VNCGTCTHWELKNSPLRAAGMGTCAREAGMFRLARTFSPSAICSKNEFQQATPATVTARDKALARQETPR
jgi:hypothetical protein